MTGRTAQRGRGWLRLAVAILVIEGILTIFYAGILPAPILPEFGIQVPGFGWMPALWLGLGGIRFVAAAIALAIAGLALALTRAELAGIPGSLLSIGPDLVVLFAVLRRWPQPGPAAGRGRRPPRQKQRSR
jgi:hypothetical protein